MNSKTNSRNVSAGISLLVSVAALSACTATADPTSQPGSDDTTQAAVGEIRVLAVEGPETDALASAASAFTDSSGTTVTVDKVPRDVWGQRKVAELAEDAGSYDVVFLGGGDDNRWLLEHANAQDLTPYLGEDVIADVENSELFTNEDGEFLGAPQYYNFPMLFYRADLFNDPAEQDAFEAAHGYPLAAPTSFDELVDVAEFFNRPDENLYGTCMGGVDWSIFIDDTYFTYGQGGNFGDFETGELTLDSPEHVQALTYINELTKFQAPGWETLSFFDCDNQMQAGSVAIYQNWLYADAVLTESMGDQIAMAPPPGEKTHLGSMLATIPDAAPNPDGAGDFIAWMLEDDYQLAQTEQTGNLPVRNSQLDSEEFAAVLPELDMLKGVAGRLTYLNSTWSGELSAGVGEAIGRMYQGEFTPQQAADWLQNEKFAGRQAIE